MTILLIRVCLIFAFVLASAPKQVTAQKNNVLRAHATLIDATGFPIGEVRFVQSPIEKEYPEPGVDVEARVEGLTPGFHGFHIHERGICEPPGFTSSMGHFDPGPASNSNPDANHPFHMGDLPNVEVNEAGIGHLRHRTSRITLSAGPLSVFDSDGSVILVHSNPDQGITGPPGSGVSGGPRIACGVITFCDAECSVQ